MAMTWYHSMTNETSKYLFFVFSHNNEETIADYLSSLIQAIFRSDSLPNDAAIYVLANGCTDNTVSTAQAYARNNTKNPSIHIEEISIAGKANAWNHAVHEVTPKHPNACIAVFLDSDILLEETDFSSLVSLLLTDSHALATTSQPRKLRLPFSPGKLIPYLASRSNQEHRNGIICGQLYAARIDFLKQIYMPCGLLVEDGFLAACLRTQLFSQEPDDSLIVAHPNVHHYFEGEESFRGLIKHETRTELGSHINFIAFPKLWSATPDTAGYLRRRYHTDPYWAITDFKNEVATQGVKVFHWSRIFSSFSQIRLSPSIIVKLFIACLRSTQKLIALVFAYRKASSNDYSW